MLAIFTYNFSRSLRAKVHSAVCHNQPWHTLYFAGSVRPNRWTLQRSGFPTRFGVSLNAAGMARWNCDQRLRRL